MKHTPGPWVAVNEHVIESSNGQVIAGAQPVNSPNMACGESRANVNLIAAAPDLLSALQYLYDEGPTKEAFEVALAAFEKAEGRSL